jgi:hypothetical protein
MINQKSKKDTLNAAKYNLTIELFYDMKNRNNKKKREKKRRRRRTRKRHVPSPLGSPNSSTAPPRDAMGGGGMLSGTLTRWGSTLIA